MKKIAIIFAAILAFAAITTAVTLSTKEEAIQWIKQYKLDASTKEQGVISSIKLTSDKVCYLNYETETVMHCQQSFNYVVNGDSFDDTISLPEDSTKEQDHATIEEYVRNQAVNIPAPEKPVISYVARVSSGEVVQT